MDETKASLDSKKDSRYRFAYLLGRIFDTPIMTFEIFLVFLFQVDISLDWLFIIVIGDMVIPLGYRIYAGLTKKMSDLDVTERSERHTWYWISAISWLATIVLIQFFNVELPQTMMLFQSWLIVFGFLNAFITLVWKISAHAMLSTSLAMWLALLWSQLFWILLFTFVPIICWGRYKTRKHTLPQLIAGALLMSVVNLLIWYIYTNHLLESI